MKRNIVSVFKPHSRGLAKLFGSLEADIMTLIWERQEASARDIFEALRDQGQRLSYGATKTVLDRLVKKQVLTRTLEGNQYLYRARSTRLRLSRHGQTPNSSPHGCCGQIWRCGRLQASPSSTVSRWCATSGARLWHRWVQAK